MKRNNCARAWFIVLAVVALIAVLVMNADAEDFGAFGAAWQQADTVYMAYYLDYVLQDLDGEGDVGSTWVADCTQRDTIFIDIAAGFHQLIYWIQYTAGDDPLPWSFVKDYGGSPTVTEIAAAVTDTAIARPSVFYGPSATGSGTDTIVIYAVDTSATPDVAKQDAKITIQNDAGEAIIAGFTNSSGTFTTYLDNGDYTIIGRKTGYIWNSTALTVTVNDDSTTITGYAVDVDVPTDADVCNVFAYLKDAQDSAYVGAEVVAVRVEGPYGIDTSGTTVIVGATPIKAIVDTLGKFELHLRETGSYADTAKGFYDITATWGGSVIFNMRALYVPDAETLNLGDSLANR